MSKKKTVRALLIGAAGTLIVVGTAFSQSKSTRLSRQPAAQWSTTILLNDDFDGLYNYKKISELTPDDRERLNDQREAATKFATAFALDRSCKGLTLLLDSRAGWPLPRGQYWWVDFRLGPTKETSLETTTRILQSLREHGPNTPYVHIDNPWFNWSIEHYTSPGTLGANEGFLGEDSDISPESAARRVCMFVKSGGPVFGGSGAETQTVQAAKGKEPTATEVFRLRSECSELGRKLLDNLPKGNGDFSIKRSQISHYNPTRNRCYVQATVEGTMAASPLVHIVTVLFDGQTGENLASLLEEGTGCPSGKECNWSGVISDTTQHYGVDEDLDHARKFMADAMEYPKEVMAAQP